MSALSHRRALNSSEESQTVPQVSLDNADFYRSGAPHPLPALPLSTGPIASTNPAGTRYESVVSSIVLALKDAGLYWLGLTLAHRFVHGESPTTKDVTVLITMERDQERDNLALAVNEILGQLYKAQISDFRVEALDPRANRRFFVPTVATGFLTATWGMLTREITAILGRTNYSWCSFTVLNRGHEESQSEPVVVIGVRRSASLEWKDRMRSKVLDLLEEAKLDMDVVFIREDSLVAGVAAPFVRNLNEFSGPVSIGSSIGMKDNIGTLGGYFTVQDQKGRKKVFGLTSHHVVFPDDTIGEAKKAGKSDMEYVDASKQGKTPWEVQSPSLANRDAALRCYDQGIKGLARTIDGYVQEVKGAEMQGAVEGMRAKVQRAILQGRDTTKLETGLRQMEESRKALIREQAELQNITDLKFATAFATSGCGQFNKHDSNGNRRAMSWALLDCVESRIGDNTVPLNKNIGAAFEGKVVQLAAKFHYGNDKSRYYAYSGSGHKVGTFSLCNVVRHSKDDPEPYGALVFVNRDLDFVCLGDSGYWILNNAGQLEALGFAASPETNCGYAIPIEDVYEDIQKRVGATIVDPELID